MRTEMTLSNRWTEIKSFRLFRFLSNIFVRGVLTHFLHTVYARRGQARHRRL